MNKRDVEDAYMLGNVAYQEFITEFEMEWNKPDIEMLLAIDLFVNRDIYGGTNGNYQRQGQGAIQAATQAAATDEAYEAYDAGPAIRGLRPNRNSAELQQVAGLPGSGGGY